MKRSYENLNFLEQGAIINHTLTDAPEEFASLLQEMNIKRRKAYYLAEVARVFEELPIKPDRLLKIGWTKLQIIHEKVTSENWAELLKIAEELSAHRLKEFVQTGEVEAPKRCVLLYFTDEEYDIYWKATQPYMSKGKTNDRKAALIAALSDRIKSSGTLQLKSKKK